VKKEYLYIAVSLLISLFIYLFYRTEKTVVNELLISIISFDTYAAWKANVVRLIPINEIVVYSLPEGLWVFCITLTSKPYYIKLRNRRMDCVFIPLVFSIGLEILQLLHVTNGRFDLMDIGVSIVFWLIGNFAFSNKAPKQNILASLNLKKVICVATYAIVYLSHVFK
jgi:hypothetical protein